LTLFLVAGISDGLDGFIARFYYQKTAFGAVLDPMADKLIMTTAFVALAIPSSAFPYTIPVWLAVLTISRDVVIVLISIVLNMILDVKRFTPTMLGKVTTFFQILYVLAVLVQNVHEIHPLFTGILTWVVAALTMASGVHYLLRVPSQTRGLA
jgi:cardiolipin synthase